MSDSLIISNLELRTHIGVPDEERLEEQTIEVTIEIFLDTKEAGKDDDVSKSIDYQLAVNDVKDLAKTERKTIEKLAEDIADMIINKFK